MLLALFRTKNKTIMKSIFKILAAPVVVCLMMAASSCQKDNVTTPLDEVLEPGEVAYKQPKPGVYTITKFTDTGDDETAQFNGYTFEFQADGDFIATTGGGTVFNGSWDLNGAETVMTLNIAGNAALNDLDDDDWTVVKITNKKIKIKANGPDVVIFQPI
jgi:hypothetical protein